MLPRDTHRKPMTPITAVLFPFVSYLLTLSRSIRGTKQISRNKVTGVHGIVKLNANSL
jgi:hypothetical protein